MEKNTSKPKSAVKNDKYHLVEKRKVFLALTLGSLGVIAFFLNLFGIPYIHWLCIIFGYVTLANSEKARNLKYPPARAAYILGIIDVVLFVAAFVLPLLFGKVATTS